MRLPDEILSLILSNLEYFNLKRAALVCKRWYRNLQFTYGKEGLNVLLKSDFPSQIIIKEQWEKDATRLNALGYKILPFSDYALSYARRHQAYQEIALALNTHYNLRGDYNLRGIIHEEMDMISLAPLVELPSEVAPSSENLEDAIECNNVTLARNILKKAYRERQKQWAAKDAIEKAQLEKDCLSELNAWRKSCLSKLFKKAKQSESCRALLKEWYELLAHDNLAKYLASPLLGIAQQNWGEQDQALNINKWCMLHWALISRLDGLAKEWIQDKNYEGVLFEGYVTTLSLLVILSCSEADTSKYVTWEALFHEVFSRIDKTQQEEFCSFFENELNNKGRFLSVILEELELRNITLAFDSENKKLFVTNFARNPDCIDTLSYRKNNIPIENDATVTKDSYNLFICKLQHLTQRPCDLQLSQETQLFFALPQGNTAKIQEIIERCGVSSIAWLDWMFRLWGILKYKKEPLDKGLNYLFETYPSLKKDIKLHHVLRLLFLGLPKTLKGMVDICQIRLNEHRKAHSNFDEAFIVMLGSTRPAALIYCMSILKVAKDKIFKALKKRLPAVEFFELLERHNCLDMWESFDWKQFCQKNILQKHVGSYKEDIKWLTFVLDREFVEPKTLFDICSQPLQAGYQLVLLEYHLLKHKALENERQYCEKIVREALEDASKVMPKALLVTFFAYGLFYQYPRIAHVMSHEGGVETIIKEYLKVDIDQLSTETTAWTANLREDLLLDWLKVCQAYKDKVQLNIGTYSVQCAYVEARVFLENYGNIFAWRDLFNQCIKAGPGSSLYAMHCKEKEKIAEIIAYEKEIGFSDDPDEEEVQNARIAYLESIQEVANALEEEQKDKENRLAERSGISRGC